MLPKSQAKPYFFLAGVQNITVNSVSSANTTAKLVQGLLKLI